MSAHFRAGAVSRTETASAAAGGCPQSVESAVLRAFEDAFGVTGCRFLRFRKCIRWSRRLFNAPLKMRRVHQKAVSGTEYLFRTVEACFLHRMLHENASRTPGSLFEHGTHIPYRKSLFLVPSPLTEASCRLIYS